MYPTKIGLAFPGERFKQLVNNIDSIDEAVKNIKAGKEVAYKFHLGGGWYVTINSGYYIVNLRRYWKPEDATTEVPTKTGIALKFDQWEQLKLAVPKLYEFHADLAVMEPCSDSISHLNQIAAFQCLECNPFLTDYERLMY